MSLTYPVKMNSTDFAKLSKKLHDKGISMTSKYHYGEPNPEEYGYVATEKNSPEYTIEHHGKTICSFRWKSDAQKVVNGLQRAFGDETTVLLDNTISTTKKQWKNPQGRWCIIADDKVEGRMVSNTQGIHYVHDDEQIIKMVVLLEKLNTDEIKLTFVIKWDSPKVQKKETIEAVMVDIPLNDMGVIQHIVESRLKLKQFGLDEEPLIECHFDAKTESRSECAPDIVAKVRKARKG